MNETTSCLVKAWLPEKQCVYLCVPVDTHTHTAFLFALVSRMTFIQHVQVNLLLQLTVVSRSLNYLVLWPYLHLRNKQRVIT